MKQRHSGLIGALLTCVCGACMPVGSGCKRNFANQNDELRARVLDLEQENAQLKQRSSELEIQLQSIQAGPNSLPSDVQAAVPRVTTIIIEKLSFARDADGDGVPESLEIYLKPQDGLGRFVQMTGTLELTAAILPMHAEPRRIGQLTLKPAELRQAYRSSFTGTHYSISVPITLPPREAEPKGGTQSPAQNQPQAAERAHVQVRFHDALTGSTIDAERPIDIH
jgi:hypothetical protein